MNLEEQYRLSFYREIAKINMHKNVCLVQHIESKQVFVRKEQKIYNIDVYRYLHGCSNPHIPQIYECIEDGDRLIIIEEFVQGKSLQDELNDGKICSEKEMCEIIITLCDVLEQLHTLPVPVIHRDIKPGNVIVQQNGYLKLIDFNTAKKYDVGKEQDTVTIGTRKYAAPEQYGFKQSDARTDIYALGVMINVLLTNEYPDKRLYTRNGKRNAISNIISKCIEFSPGDRYQTVAELRKDIERVHKKGDGGYITNTTGFWNNKYLPPGFRTGTIGKMFIAVIGYFFVFWISVTSEFTKTEGVPMAGIELWANRITILIWMLGTIFFEANYLDIQNQFPLMNKKGRKWLGYLLYPFLFLIGLVIILAVLTT